MVRHHQSTAAVAVTLALAASLAPTASADPAPTPAGTPAPCGDVCSGHGYGLVSTPAHVASSKPVSQANQAGTPAPCGDVCSGHGYGAAGPEPTIVRVTSGGGFHWGDAGIGAGACAVLLGIGLAGTRTVTNGRKRPNAEQPKVATG